MSRIIVPSRRVWTRQPQRFVSLDADAAKALGVEYLAIANETCALRDLVGGSTLTNPGGGSVGEQGRVWTFNGSQAANKAFTVDTANLGQYLVCARIKATASQAGSPGGAFGLFSSTEQSGFGVAFDSSNQVGAGYLSNSGAGMTCYSAGVINKFYDVFVHLGSNSTLKAWINGAPAATNQGGAVSNFFLSQNEIAVGAQHRSSGFLRQFTGHIEWVALLKLDSATYTDAFCSRLYSDRFPYSVLRPRTRRTIIDLGGSGLSAVYADSALSYYIRSLLSSDSGIQYAIRNAIYKDDAVGYYLRSAIAQNSEVGYVLRSAISKDDAEAYKIRGLVQSSDAETYSIRGLVQTSDSDAYKIRGQVQADTSTSYDIQSSTSVASSNAVNYSVRGAVAASVLVGYSVRGSAQRDAASAYSVRSAASRDVVASYAVSASASSVYADSTASYSVDGGVPSGPSAESIAAAVLAALQATTIPVNNTLINGAPVIGDGSEANPWRGVGVQP